MAKIIVREQGEERVYKIEEPAITVGRTKNNHITIQDPRSSRKHCKIQKTPQGFKLFDLKSRNGVFLNGKPATEELLKSGDKIEIGDTILFFEEEGSPSPPAEKPQWCLKITSGSLKGKALLLGEDPLLIGSHKAADLQIEEEGIATHHAQILPAGDGYSIVDLNTEEGTYVNGKKVTKTDLKPEMVISLGSQTTLRFTRRVKSSERKKKSSRRAQATPPPVSEGAAPPTSSAPSRPSKSPAGTSEPPIAPEALLEEEAEGFPSQADFEAVDLEGVVEPSNTMAILNTIGVTVLFVLFLVFGIHFLYNFFAPVEPDPSKEGNQILNWSFEKVEGEGKVQYWQLSEGASLDREHFLGGQSSLRLRGQQATIPTGKSDKILISPDKNYFLRAYLRLEGAGPSGLKIIWSNEARGFRKEVYTRLQEGNTEWKEVTANLRPPRRANALQISCFTLGATGEAWFDRIYLRKKERKESDIVEVESYPLLLDDNVIMEIRPQGLFSLFWGEELTEHFGGNKKKDSRLSLYPYFSGGELILFSSDPTSISRQTLAEVISDPTAKKDIFKVKGKIYDKGKRRWIEFKEEITSREEKLSIHYELVDSNQAGDLTFSFHQNKSQSFRLPSEEKTYEKNFEIPQCTELVWGQGKEKIVFTFPRPALVRGVKKNKNKYITFTWKSTDSFSFHIARVSDKERAAQKLALDRVKDLERKGEWEEALAVWQKIRKKFSYQEDLAEKARKRINHIRSLKKSYQKDLLQIRQDLQNVLSLFLVASCRKKCEKIAMAFPSLAVEVGKVLQELNSITEKIKIRQKKIQARKLMEKGEQTLGKGLQESDSATLALAAAYYREIIRHYPQDPQILREAKHKLKLIEERLRHQQKKLLNN